MRKLLVSLTVLVISVAVSPAMSVFASFENIDFSNFPIYDFNEADTTGKVDVFGVSVSHNLFDPNLTGVKVFYSLSRTAQVTVRVWKGMNVVANLKNGLLETAAGHEAFWAGKAGNQVIEGPYTIEISAVAPENFNNFDTESLVVTVLKSSGSGGFFGPVPPDLAFPDITSVIVSPNPFDPNKNVATIHYALAADALVSIRIFYNNALFDNVMIQGTRSAGLHQELWTGVDDFGNKVNFEGTFSVQVTAQNSVGTDVETSFAIVDFDQTFKPLPTGCTNFFDCPSSPYPQGFSGDGAFPPYFSAPQVFNLFVDSDPYLPNTGALKIHYSITQGSLVTVQVTTTQASYTITLNDQEASGSHLKFWDPKGYVPGGVYKVKVTASNPFGADARDIEFVVNPFLTVEAACAGFFDIPTSSPYCAAVNEMKLLGVFSGYADGSFKPNTPITRAQTLKVLLKAFKVQIMSANMSALGFYDVTPGEWYMPYLATAVKLGIVRGYGDGTFRPNKTVTRAEFMKMFFMTLNVQLPSCTVQPYADTPITPSNSWFIDFACAAKKYKLIGTVNMNSTGNFVLTPVSYFHPNEPLTRGDVAAMLFQAHLKGLLKATQFGINQQSSLTY